MPCITHTSYTDCMPVCRSVSLVWQYITCSVHFSSSAITIGFNDTSYAVTEGGSVGVSVSVLSGPLTRDVVVTLQTADGTATGEAVSQ